MTYEVYFPPYFFLPYLTWILLLWLWCLMAENWVIQILAPVILSKLFRMFELDWSWLVWIWMKKFWTILVKNKFLLNLKQLEFVMTILEFLGYVHIWNLATAMQNCLCWLEFHADMIFSFLIDLGTCFFVFYVLLAFILLVLLLTVLLYIPNQYKTSFSQFCLLFNYLAKWSGSCNLFN